MKVRGYYILLLLIVFFGRAYTQIPPDPATAPGVVPPKAAPVTAPPAGFIVTANTRDPKIVRPSGTIDMPEIDNYVAQCYDLYDKTNNIDNQLTTIQQQLIMKKPSESDVDAVDGQMRTIRTELVDLRTTGLGLMQAGSDMSNNAVTDLKGKPLKIPSAVIRVKNATKAAKVSLDDINTMLTVTTVNINHKLHPSSKADTAKNQSAGANAVTLPITGKTMKTSVSIIGLSFTSFNSFSDEVVAIAGIKSAEKKFNASGTSQIQIIHYGTTDDLLHVLLSACKDILTDKNVKTDEKGKIGLEF